MSLPDWAYELDGIPYQDKGRTLDGTDCWGLVYLALARMGWIVPSYSEEYASAEERETVASLIDGKRSDWLEVPLGSEQVGDVLLLRVTGEDPTHVGVVVGMGMMLHQRFGVRSVVETYKSGIWSKPKRIAGVYRYAGG